MANKLDRLVTFDGAHFRIYFPYSAALVNAVKQLPQRKFNKDGAGTFWTAYFDRVNIPSLPQFIIKEGFTVEAEAAEKLSELAALYNAAPVIASVMTTTGTISLIEDDSGKITGFKVFTPTYIAGVHDILKRFQARWFKEIKTWECKFSRKAVEGMNALISEFQYTTTENFSEKVSTQLADIDAAINESRQADTDREITAPEGLTYRPFQKAGIAFGLDRGNVLIGDEMGLGKTIQGVGISNMRPDVRKILIIGPASLKINWRREWKKWDIKGLSIGFVSGEDTTQFPNTDVVIISFNLVKAYHAILRSITWDMVIIDEVHNLRNIKTSERTQYVFGFENAKKKIAPLDAKYKVALTGTPIVNRPIEMWPYLQWLAPQQFNHFFNYAKRYCGAHQTGYGWKFDGATNLDELQELLRSTVMIRRLKKDVAKELPKKIRQIIPIEDETIAAMEAAGLNAIKEMIEKLEAEKVLAYLRDDKKGYEEAATKLQAARRFAFDEMARLRHEVALAKVPHIIKLAQDSLENGKVIIFAHHHDVIDKFKKEFKDAAVVLTGDMTVEKRQKAVDRFQTDATCTVFIGSIQAAGVGYTLTAANHLIFAELSWVPADITQAEDRAHRIGATGEAVLAWHVVVENTVESRMIEILVQKQNIMDAALDTAVESEKTEVLNNVVSETKQEILLPKEFLMPDLQVVDTDQVDAWLNGGRDKAQKYANASERAKARAEERGFAAEGIKMTAEEIEAVHANLRYLADRCDYAQEQDAKGFNKPDTVVGHALAYQEILLPVQAAYARKMIRKYIGQLGDDSVKAMGKAL